MANSHVFFLLSYARNFAEVWSRVVFSAKKNTLKIIMDMKLSEVNKKIYGQKAMKILKNVLEGYL